LKVHKQVLNFFPASQHLIIINSLPTASSPAAAQDDESYVLARLEEAPAIYQWTLEKDSVLKVVRGWPQDVIPFAIFSFLFSQRNRR